MTGGPPVGQPEFLWDPRRLRLTWANIDGLVFWGEDSLFDLAERVFTADDETTRAFSARISEISEGGDGKGVLFFRPQAEPVGVYAQCAMETGPDGQELLRISLTGEKPAGDRLLALARVGFTLRRNHWLFLLQMARSWPGMKQTGMPLALAGYLIVTGIRRRGGWR